MRTKLLKPTFRVALRIFCSPKILGFDKRWKMNHYYKRRWDESRGDEYDGWGESWWLFETDEKFWPQRQIEIYDSGPILFYSHSHLDDAFGGLGRAALEQDEFEPFRITEEEFEREWSTLKPSNAA